VSANPEVNPYSATKFGSGLESAPAAAQSSTYQNLIWVAMAAFAMVGTLPGRTHGLGLVTKYLLQDMQLSEVTYGRMNMGATLIGALFCLPAGWLLDRLGSRMVLTFVAATLGAIVWFMSGVIGIVPMFLLIMLTRGMGQSALSVVSISMIGKKFTGRLAWATSAYSILMSVGFAIAFPLVGSRIQQAIEIHGAAGWRTAWAEIGMVLIFGLAPLALLLLRTPPQLKDAESTAIPTEEGYSLGAALATPAFWIFAGATSLYGLAVSGVGLFNQGILEERGFNANDYYNTLRFSTLVSLAAQFATGALATRWSFQRLVALAMALYAAGLVGLTLIHQHWHLWACTALLGAAGGIIMVTFFAIWGHAFGRAQLGRIQGVAQMLTVLASSVGPVLFSECKARDWGSLGNNTYSPVLYLLAGIVILLGIAAWFVQLPKRSLEPGETEVALNH
jgi:MFS family permease